MSSKKFDRILEKATDPTLLEPDWAAILQCVDAIRGGDVSARPAVESIQRRYRSENPHVSHHALLVLEAVVKNCGDRVHKEVATKEFMEDMKHLAMESKADIVKEKILEMVQCWAHAFRGNNEYKIVLDTHNLMKLEGFEFPSLRESDAMFAAESAPEWIDNDACYRCRTAFGLLTRKHHCRACGQIFCDKCSSRQVILPHLGIEREVRVCETCYSKNLKENPAKEETEKPSADTKPTQEGAPKPSDPATGAVPKDKKKFWFGKKHKKSKNHLAVKSSSGAANSSSSAVKSSPSAVKSSIQGSATLTGAQKEMLLRKARALAKERELKQREEEDIELAMAISQSEQEEKDRQRQLQLYHLYNGPDSGDEAPTTKQNSTSTNGAGFGYKGIQDPKAQEPANTAENDPELARYLNRNYWEQRHKDQKQGILRQSPTPSAPPSTEPALESTNQNAPPAEPRVETAVVENYAVQNGEVQTNGELTDNEQFAVALKSQVEVFVNRIKSNQARGRSIVNDSSIQTLFLTLTSLHANLLQRMGTLDDKRGYYESLQDRLAHIEEARQAVNALREEHERQKQAALAEEQRRRQMAMQQKLDVMRQKKHEMLEQQRLVALQRFQQQQIEIQMRQRQLAAGYMMQGQQAPQMLSMAPGQPQYGMMPQQPQMASMPPNMPMYQQPYDMQNMAQALPQQQMTYGTMVQQPGMIPAGQTVVTGQQPAMAPVTQPGMAPVVTGPQSMVQGQTAPHSMVPQQPQSMPAYPGMVPAGQQVIPPQHMYQQQPAQQTQYQQPVTQPQQQVYNPPPPQYMQAQPEQQQQAPVAPVQEAMKQEPDVGLLIQF